GMRRLPTSRGSSSMTASSITTTAPSETRGASSRWRRARTCGAEDHNMKLKLVIGLLAVLLAAPATFAAPADDEAAYTQAIEKRTADIISALDLKDEAKAARVHDAIVNQYRALRDWQEKNDAAKKAKDAPKQEELMAERKALHDQFLSKLSPELSPEQIDI